MKISRKVWSSAGSSGPPQLMEITLGLRSLSWTAEQLQTTWPPAKDPDSDLGQFIDMLVEAAEVTLGPQRLGVINWLVSNARDANLFS